MSSESEGGDPRSAFDASSIPGMRQRLEKMYEEFRAAEENVNAKRAPPSAGGSVGNYYVRDCPGCATAQTAARAVQKARGLTLLLCPGCGLTYTREVMEEISDAARYRASDIDEVTLRLRDSEPYLEMESARARYYLDRVAAYAGTVQGTLLDIGCGSGTFIVEAQKRGWECLGLEPGRGAAEQARQRGARVVEGFFPRDLPGDGMRFGMIAMLDVLEHIIEPRRFLREVRARLDSDGVLFVQVPNWDSLLVQAEGQRSTIIAPGHWSYFTCGTLMTMVEREGFTTLGIETVVSEIDRISKCDTKIITDTLRRLRPESSLAWPLQPADLYWHDLGYKLIGVFRRT